MSTLPPKREDLPESIKWVDIWETPGILPAEVVAGRLRAEGIPAWVWQQGAGSAMGLTFGPMGRGHVMVPEKEAENARILLTTAGSYVVDGENWEDQEDESSDIDKDDGWLGKGFLALTALAVSPIGVAAAFIVAKLFDGKDKFSGHCRECEMTFDLDEEEINQGWFVCPECGRTNQS